MRLFFRAEFVNPMLFPDMRPPRCLSVVLCLSFFLGASQRIEARQIGHDDDAQLQQAVAQAAQVSDVDRAQAMFIRRRDDLDENLAKISEKAGSKVSFYDTGPARTAMGSNSGYTWAAVSGNSPQESYTLYRFGDSEGFEQTSQEFSRLTAQLALSLGAEQATSMARFFVDCCLGGKPGEVVTNEDELRHAVVRDYMQVFGNIWRALDAYADWWQGYQNNAAQVPRTSTIPNGAIRLTVQRLASGFGMHPELEYWDVEIFPDARVHVFAVESVFPKPGRWLFYNSGPPIVPVGE